MTINPEGVDIVQAFARCPLPKRKLSCIDNFELVAMRHREFRRVPNPTKAQLELFKPVARMAAQRFLGLNRDVCRFHGYDYEDLLTYGLVWTTNFLGLYAKPGGAVVHDENCKLLHSYLKQRFWELRTLICNKGRNCIPQVEVAAMNEPSRSAWENTEPDLQVRNCELDLRSAGRRRKSARDLLAGLLNDLPHERLVSVLANVAESEACDLGARHEARKRLRKHRDSCQTCSAA